MKEHFINELRNLLNMVCAQGGQVEELVRLALESVTRTDPQLADNVIARDPAIDQEEIHIEEECLKILALYQPVASDLRTIIAILKINTALERMADLGVHIAERVPDIATGAHDTSLPLLDFSSMGQAGMGMLRDALAAMRHSDPVLAYSVIKKDDVVDAAHKDNLLSARKSVALFPAQAGYYLGCIDISFALERIADMASHICEHVIYLETGKIIRHRQDTTA